MGASGKRHAPAALPPGSRSDNHCAVDWVGLRAGLGRRGKSHFHRDSFPGPSNP